MYKPLGKRYPKVISIRLTEEEKNGLDELTRGLNISKSKFLRKKICRILSSKQY